MDTKVKICGVSRLDDARAAVELGAWAIGMVMWEGSARACRLEEAETIGQALHRRVEIAGVFVNATLDRVADVADRCGLTLLQLHGDEGPAYCREAARRTGARVIKAGRIRDASSVRALNAFRTDFHLLDAFVAGRPGGTGTTFSWDLASKVPTGTPTILSGGLTAENVAAGIAAVHPFAVDTASGTEASPGIKDLDRMTDLFAAVRSTEEPTTAPAEGLA